MADVVPEEYELASRLGRHTSGCLLFITLWLPMYDALSPISLHACGTVKSWIAFTRAPMHFHAQSMQPSYATLQALESLLGQESKVLHMLLTHRQLNLD